MPWSSSATIPCRPGPTGPSITITADDMAEYDNELHNDQSTVPIQTGEVLTERQMLEALLTQSANDMAYSLAVWDAGSCRAFVAKMNAMAASLGATATHYVDASGYDPGSVSTASDVLRVAAAGMADPTFAEVVGMAVHRLPRVGTVPNVVTEIGKNGVIGIKSGYTSKAGGCLVLAANRVEGGRHRPGAGGRAGPADAAAHRAEDHHHHGTQAGATTTTDAPRPPAWSRRQRRRRPRPRHRRRRPPRPPFRWTISRCPIRFKLHPTGDRGPADRGPGRGGPGDGGHQGRGRWARPPPTWGGQPHRVAVVAGSSASLLGWPGQQVAAATTLGPGAVPAGPRGVRSGRRTSPSGRQSETVPLKLAATVPEPSWWWRLVHD